MDSKILTPGIHKVLTVRQPYATLIATGIKHYETRSKKWHHRGPTLIHSGIAKLGKSERALIETLNFRFPNLGISCNPNDYPLGSILCEVDFVDCIPAVEAPTELERLIGFWQPTFYALRLTNVKPLFIPNIKGQLGFWNYSTDNIQGLKNAS
ncbi:MAG: hypothetical protein ACRC78_04335 [Planktothrix sp.]